MTNDNETFGSMMIMLLHRRAVVLVQMTYIYTAALSIVIQYNLLGYQH